MTKQKILNEVRKNVHQTHFEDLVLLGQEGLNELNMKISSFIDMLKNDNKNNINTTIKIDGAPAVVMWHKFEGYPDDSICLKSFVNGPKNAISSKEEIQMRYGDRPVMSEMLNFCLELAKYIPSNEAWQGDCLFTKDSKELKNINGTDFITFQPNTIIYAFSENDKDYNNIINADFGIAFHTIYRISEDRNISQSFNVNGLELSGAPRNIFIMSPIIKNINKENYNINSIEMLYNDLQSIESLLINDDAYTDLVNNDLFMNYWNKFENSVLADQKLGLINESTFINDLRSFINNKLNLEKSKRLSTLKTDNYRQSALLRYNALLDELSNILDSKSSTLLLIVRALNTAIKIKMLLLDGFKKVKQGYSTFVKSKINGYIPTDMEGIAMSDNLGNIVKIVDRSNFSSNNRSSDIIKGFEHESLQEQDEINNKGAVVAFGRLNPPTKGHELLVDTISELALKNNFDGLLYLSHSVDSNKNPLSYSSKLNWCKKAFGDKVTVVESDSRSLFNVLEELYDKGYKNIIYVSGSDREKDSQQLVKYNGKLNRDGNMPYKFDSIDIVIAGEDRLSESNDIPVEKVSASLARFYAKEGMIDEFMECCPSKLDNDEREELYYEVREGLGLFESLEEQYTLEEAVKYLTKARLKNFDIKNEFDKKLDDIDVNLDAPDARIQDYKSDKRDEYTGLFYETNDVVAFSDPDIVAMYDEETRNELNDLSIDDPINDDEYKLHLSRQSVNDKKIYGAKTTKYQESIQLLLLTDSIDYDGDLINWLKKSNPNKNTGIFKYIYSDGISIDEWLGFIENWKKSFTACVNQRDKFYSVVKQATKHSFSNLIPYHDNIKGREVVSQLLKSNDKLDKSDGYICLGQYSNDADAIIETLISLKSDPIEYVDYITSPKVRGKFVGVSLKQNNGILNVEYDIEPYNDNLLTGDALLHMMNSGGIIKFKLSSGKILDLACRSAGVTNKIDLGISGMHSRLGNAKEGFKSVLGNLWYKIYDAEDLQKTTKNIMKLITNNRVTEDKWVKLSRDGLELLLNVINFSSGFASYDKDGRRITAPYIKVY